MCEGDGSSNILNPVTETLRPSASELFKTNYTHCSCSYVHSHLPPLLFSGLSTFNCSLYLLFCFISTLYLHTKSLSVIFSPLFLTISLCFLFIRFHVKCSEFSNNYGRFLEILYTLLSVTQLLTNPMGPAIVIRHKAEEAAAVFIVFYIFFH